MLASSDPACTQPPAVACAAHRSSPRSGRARSSQQGLPCRASAQSRGSPARGRCGPRPTCRRTLECGLARPGTRQHTPLPCRPAREPASSAGGSPSRNGRRSRPCPRARLSRARAAHPRFSRCGRWRHKDSAHAHVEEIDDRGDVVLRRRVLTVLPQGYRLPCARNTAGLRDGGGDLLQRKLQAFAKEPEHLRKFHDQLLSYSKSDVNRMIDKGARSRVRRIPC